MSIGKTRWVIADGYIPPGSTHGEDPRFVSHEAACILNAGEHEANLRLTVFFVDREPAGPFLVRIGARRTRHLRFNDLRDPESIPADTPYSCLIESDQPVVVQHTRLDSRQAELALLSTIAYSGDS